MHSSIRGFHVGFDMRPFQRVHLQDTLECKNNKNFLLNTALSRPTELVPKKYSRLSKFSRHNVFLIAPDKLLLFQPESTGIFLNKNVYWGYSLEVPH